MSVIFEPVKYENQRFIGKEIICDREFIPSLEYLNECARNNGLWIYVTSSFRWIDQKIYDAIVNQAKKSCHYVGHAIDHNICELSEFGKIKQIWNSHAMSHFDSLPDNVQMFYEDVCKRLRWGGKFFPIEKFDPVHIDDNLFYNDPESYYSKLESAEAQR